ncbi:hypothetical protein VTJ49DRAFT_5689 [Mycothermus thermophilus]|uniref:Uncharacterized protein n=1 Tax=Humicola insolens TaxID=85995 RepID=A0ABR3V2L0_HUMIN
MRDDERVESSRRVSQKERRRRKASSRWRARGRVERLGGGKPRRGLTTLRVEICVVARMQGLWQQLVCSLQRPNVWISQFGDAMVWGGGPIPRRLVSCVALGTVWMQWRCSCRGRVQVDETDSSLLSSLFWLMRVARRWAVVHLPGCVEIEL